ncbi:homogentisate 1,2-dioxygenase [Aureococcus anophagefferens]|nr:homogentisate 1,2-dioxygenase [Aureococcus anophagefferens]
MVDKAYASADGHLLIVPERGALRVTTELGRLRCAPGAASWCRNVLFSVAIDGEFARGCWRPTPARLPYRSSAPSAPTASPRRATSRRPSRYEDRECAFQITKFAAASASAATHSVFDVVAWRGTYAPVVYDLERFVPVNAVKCDHPTRRSSRCSRCRRRRACRGRLRRLPERYACAVDTFRPPYFHKNVMSEFMGLIRGAATAGRAIGPAAPSLHGAGVPHGPDAETFAAASTCDVAARHARGRPGLHVRDGARLRAPAYALGGPAPRRGYA